MKNLFPKIAIVLVAISLSTFFVVSCSVQDLTQDITLYTGNGFLTNPITIQVGDAAKLENVPDQLTITVEGRDKSKIFTMFGQSKIQAIGGIISLAVKMADAPTPTQPLVFTLVFTAPNYTTVRKNFNLTAGGDLQTQEVKMINLTAPPTGVSVQNSSFTSTTATGTAQDVPFASPLTNGKVEQVNLTIKAGTKPLAADGSVLSGTIQTELVHFDGRSEASLNALPEKLAGLTLKQGTTTGQVNMDVASYYSMNMTVGTTKVAKFSTPMDVSLDIDPDFYMVALDRKVKEGDVLDIISRDESETTWASETQATVTNVNGKLKANFKQPHLSIWMIGSFSNSIKIVFPSVSTDLPVAGKDVNCSVARQTFKYKIIAANSNKVYSSGTSTLGNNEVLSDTVITDNKSKVKMVVYDTKGKELYRTAAQCLFSNPVFNLKGNLPANKSVVVKLNVGAFCGGAINTVLTP